MAELREVFEIVTKQVEPDRDSWREQEKRQRRTSRNRKLSALAVAAVIMAAIALFAATALRRGKDGSAPATVVPSGSGLTLTEVGIDGSVRSTTRLPKGAMTPAISPDGASVAFVLLDGPVSQIATMRLDGTGLHVITNDPISSVRPRWSPDGSQLVFYREDRNSVLHLMVMNADGTSVREIPGTHNPDNLPPDWSPDGSLILYSSMYTAFGSLYDDLSTIPATGGPSHRLTTTGLVDEAGGDWSPDGRSIAFKRLNGGDWEIWVMNADGTGQRRVAALPNVNAEAPDWSPDGSKIAFIGSVGGIDGSGKGHGSVYVVDVATGDITKVLRGVATGNLDSIIDARATWLPGGHAVLVMTGTP